MIDGWMDGWKDTDVDTDKAKDDADGVAPQDKEKVYYIYNII